MNGMTLNRAGGCGDDDDGPHLGMEGCRSLSFLRSIRCICCLHELVPVDRMIECALALLGHTSLSRQTTATTHSTLHRLHTSTDQQQHSASLLHSKGQTYQNQFTCRWKVFIHANINLESQD